MQAALEICIAALRHRAEPKPLRVAQTWTGSSGGLNIHGTGLTVGHIIRHITLPLTGMFLSSMENHAMPELRFDIHFSGIKISA
jgi:hypothetical protein